MMFAAIKKLYFLLTPEQKSRFYKLQLLVIVAAIFEIIGVASIGPFIALVSKMSILDGSNIMAKIFQISGIHLKEDFVFFVGVVVLFIMMISTLISIFATWRLSLFASSVGVEISDRLFTYYMQEPWLFHVSRNSAQLTKQIATEAGRMAILVISPILQIGAKTVFIIFMISAICFYNPLVAFVGFMVFAFTYGFIFKFVRLKLKNNGEQISQELTNRYKLMSEGFGGIKDIILLGRQNYYVDRFIMSGKIFSSRQGINQTLATIPKNIMEFIAFGSIIFIILILVRMYNSRIEEILPILTVFALAGFKLLPSFQSIYANLSHIRGNIASFEQISEDLQNSLINSKIKSYGESNLSFGDSININNIIFRYPNKMLPALNGLNMVIKSNQIVGIVGASGSGKSTFVDLLLGLISPEEGSIKIDGIKLDKGNMRSWRNKIGYVPQNIYLSDGNFIDNIAIGLNENEINYEKINLVLEQAHLSEVISSLPQGAYTNIGERGVQLSGGQRQRIGIARALYHDAEVLIFDEATSALDNITERLIVDAIHNFSGAKTIVMIAHRLSTIEKCDIIYFFDDGRIIDYGTYSELIEKNGKFKNMAVTTNE